MLQICLKTTSGNEKWFLDSGCSRHMTGDASKFVQLILKDEGYVTFGDNAKGKVIGRGKIGNDKVFIDNVVLVDTLKHNLLSISQLCDKGYKVTFMAHQCLVQDIELNTILIAKRDNNVYTIKFDDFVSQDIKCLSSTQDLGWLWHRRLGHASMDLIQKLSSNELVRGLPKSKFNKDRICDACQFGKQVKSSFKSKNLVSTSRPLELIHLDLFGPNDIASIQGKFYVFVIVDDYSRYTWVLFLAHKSDAFNEFVKWCKKVQNEQGHMITFVRSDRGGEFRNQHIEGYCDEVGYAHNFSAPKTPQQNGVVERKNRSIQEMARTMLNENKLPRYFWAEAVNTACYVGNRVVIRPMLAKTPYELWKGHKPNISYFKVFGCKCFILNDRDPLAKFDPKSDEGIFLGYASNSKAYRVYNKRTYSIQESIHVVFDETNPFAPKVVEHEENDHINVQKQLDINERQEEVPKNEDEQICEEETSQPPRE